MSDTENRAQDQARSQVESIYAMVAALDVDYDRLEELRDMREELREEFDSHPENVGVDFDHWCRNQQTMTSEDVDEFFELQNAAGDCTDGDEARQRIEEDALSVEVRSDWCNPGEEMTAGEFRIVLCTGGPHVELVGDLDDNKQPSRVRVLFRDWGESGELFDFDRDTVLRYCSVFYFGE